jgi:hypothetical protein
MTPAELQHEIRIWSQQIGRRLTGPLGEQSRHPAGGEGCGKGKAQMRARGFGREDAVVG